MKKVVFYSFVLVAVLGGGTSCQKDDVSNAVNQGKVVGQETPWEVPTYSEIRAATYDLPAERYLGKGFNTLRYPLTHSEGFSDYAVLSTQSGAWSPFGREIEEEDLEPIVVSYGTPGELVGYRNEGITESSAMDSISFSANAKYSKTSLTYKTQDITRHLDKSHTFSSFVGRKKKLVMLDLGDADNLEFYLHKRFTRDLSRLSATDLVAKYGTHVVTRYYIGPYMHLKVAAKASSFSKEDIKTIEGKLWSDNFTINKELKSKISRKASDISVIYRQGGSDYIPNNALFNVGELYKEVSTVAALDYEAWHTKIREDNTFLMVAGEQSALHPIPDLISDIPLKIKYVSGILFQTLPPNASGLNYLLCDPRTYEPFKHKGKYLSVGLRHYGNSMEMMDWGLDSNQLFFEGLLLGGNGASHKWDFELQANGLWLVRSRFSGRYLCLDGRLKTQAEDTENLRYWLLNPIVPTPGGNLVKASQLYIKTQKQ